MQYTVVKVPARNISEEDLAKAINKLAEEVNKYIQAGWTPLGGAASAVGVGAVVFQAMTKE